MKIKLKAVDDTNIIKAHIGAYRKVHNCIVSDQGDLDQVVSDLYELGYDLRVLKNAKYHDEVFEAELGEMHTSGRLLRKRNKFQIMVLDVNQLEINGAKVDLMFNGESVEFGIIEIESTSGMRRFLQLSTYDYKEFMLESLDTTFTAT
jgi:hypothetical protein